MKVRRVFSAFAQKCAYAVGTWQAFVVSFFFILIWLGSGVYFGYTDTLYQLAVNSSTTIITFLMIFLLQHTQNRDTIATHLKLDELILANEKARNAMLRIEEREEEEIEQIRSTFVEVIEKKAD